MQAQQPRQRGRPNKTVVSYLIFDDSVHIKPKGRKMGGLGKHYSHSEGRVVNGHCMFTGLYMLLGHRCPLPSHLYRNKQVCDQEGEPFQSKIDLAIEEIEHFEPVQDTHTYVLIDSWYHCKRIRKAAQGRNYDVSGAIKSNRKMHMIINDCERKWIELAQYARQLKSQDWQEVFWPSQHGGQKWYAHMISTWVSNLGPTLLLITCQDPNQPDRTICFWGSTAMSLDAQAFGDILAIRWNIETFFEYTKDLLGSDHYQVMSAQAIIRF
ncbi:MAG: transposase [Anaerolineales bacterium]